MPIAIDAGAAARVNLGAHFTRFQAFFRNVRADLSPTAGSFFSKNGCAVSVTIWGDHLAQLMQKMFRRALSDPPPPPPAPPPPPPPGGG
eukprot:COSAG01_NODE_3686_length_5796_cov_13.667720_1_plen_88_part_10